MVLILLTLCALFAVQGSGGPAISARAIAVTVDDLPTVSVVGNDIESAERTTRELVAAIRRAGVPAIGFVNEGKLQRGGTVDPRRVALLRQWVDAGLELGNHTSSHIDLHATDVRSFVEDIDRGDRAITALLGAKGQKPRFFRHPFLHTGRSLADRDTVVKALEERGYAVAPVTINSHDYIFAAAYDLALAADDADLARRIVAAYLDYVDAMVEYHEQQSVAIVGREIAQTLLLHANALNAAAFGELANRLRQRGYRFVPLAEALDDPAYRLPDDYVGPDGLTWLHRWAQAAGKAHLVAAQPVMPEWVQKASEIRRK